MINPYESKVKISECPAVIKDKCNIYNGLLAAWEAKEEMNIRNSDFMKDVLAVVDKFAYDMLTKG